MNEALRKLMKQEIDAAVDAVLNGTYEIQDVQNEILVQKIKLLAKIRKSMAIQDEILDIQDEILAEQDVELAEKKAELMKKDAKIKELEAKLAAAIGYEHSLV